MRACSASPTARTAKPASSRFTRKSSWMAGSSSTTRIEVIIGVGAASFRELRANLLSRGVPDILALDDVNHMLRDIFGVIADALDRLGNEHDLQCGRDRARILHHVTDELAQDREKRGIDRL